MEELKGKLEELGRLFAQFKAENDAKLKQIETKGTASAEQEVKVGKLNDAITGVEAEIKAMKTAMNRTQQQNDQPDEVQAKNEKRQAAYKQAVVDYIRKGSVAGIEAYKAEYKDMSVDSDADGGFLVTPEMSAEVVKKVFESSPIRQLASVQSISSDSLEILEDLDEVSSGWVGENQSRPKTNTAVLKMIKIPVHELYAEPYATQKLLDDASINVESWLASKIAEKFARDEATAFVSGNGSMKPKGFLSYADGTSFGLVEQFETAGSGVIAADDLIKLSYKLKEFYKAGAVWLMKRETIGLVRLLKDSQNRYLWSPGLDGATASSILGFPIYEAADMPTVAASALSVAFGNVKQGYQIVDRVGIRTIRDIYTAKPGVLFYSTKRVGGAVKNFEAMKILKIKA